MVGGVIPKEYIPAVIKGIEEGLSTGVLAGYNFVDVKVAIVYGSYHEVDSNEMAFKICGSMAIKEAARKVKPIILEPIMKVDVTTPETCIGDVIGDLNRRRGQIMGQETLKGRLLSTRKFLSARCLVTRPIPLTLIRARNLCDGAKPF